MEARKKKSSRLLAWVVVIAVAFTMTLPSSFVWAAETGATQEKVVTEDQTPTEAPAVEESSNKDPTEAAKAQTEKPAAKKAAKAATTGTDEPGGTDSTENPAVSIDGTGYASLAEAVQAVKDDDVIDVNRDLTGNGVKVASNKKFTINFNGHKFDIDGETVGSTGTETNGFQLLKESTITFENGTITSTKAKLLVQNYCNLTLENMKLIGTDVTDYVLSNNCGEVKITGNTDIIAADGKAAFDVCWAPNNYPKGTQVTVDTEGTIKGTIEIGDWDDKVDGTTSKSSLTINKVKHEGSISNISKLTGDAATKVTITGGTFSADPSEYLVKGYFAEKEKDGNYYTVKASVSIGDKGYESLAEAIDAVEENGTIKVNRDLTGNGVKVASNKKFTIDFDGHEFDIDGETVGSTGTETNGFQLLKDSTITFENGTITSTKAKLLVQNY